MMKFALVPPLCLILRLFLLCSITLLSNAFSTICSVPRSPYLPRCFPKQTPLFHAASCNTEETRTAPTWTPINDDLIRTVWSVATSHHVNDAKHSLEQSPLVAETLVGKENQRVTTVPFERLDSERSDTSFSPPIIRTLGPVFNKKDCRTVLKSANDYWANQKESSSHSKFTLQGIRKRELHVASLNQDAIHIVNKALSESVYPLIRQSYGDDVIPSGYSLLLYDALIIEYDASSLDEQATIDECPSQPLHSDLGLVSVNIALDCPVNGFTGGGTVFERLLMEKDIGETDESALVRDATLLPIGTGHALVHSSRDRHAGGALTSGKRTIMVLFVTAANLLNGDKIKACPKQELVARCISLGMSLAQPGKQIPVPLSPSFNRAKDSILCGVDHRIGCYQAATCADPLDAETWLSLGMALMGAASAAQASPTHKRKALQEVLDFLVRARELNPADGRVYNSLGLTLKELSTLEDSSRQDYPAYDETIVTQFSTAATLFERAARAGCKGANAEARSALLNWGLWHADCDEFDKAVEILSRIFDTDHFVSAVNIQDASNQNEKGNHFDQRVEQANRVVQDAMTLLKYCEKRDSEQIAAS